MGHMGHSFYGTGPCVRAPLRTANLFFSIICHVLLRFLYLTCSSLMKTLKVH